jgi:hypothetical protein
MSKYQDKMYMEKCSSTFFETFTSQFFLLEQSGPMFLCVFPEGVGTIIPALYVSDDAWLYTDVRTLVCHDAGRCGRQSLATKPSQSDAYESQLDHFSTIYLSDLCPIITCKTRGHWIPAVSTMHVRRPIRRPVTKCFLILFDGATYTHTNQKPQSLDLEIDGSQQETASK